MGIKNCRFHVVIGVLVTALFLSAGGWAQTSKDDFQQGLDAAAAGHYDQAVTYFLRAKQAGSKRPALDYNIGVAYYKLGRYELAREAFMRLADELGFQQLAYFNLGLVANKAKDEKAAVAWFRRAYNGSDANIKTLSAQALQRLGAKPRKPVAASKPWSGFVATLLSYDSNVTLINDDLIGNTSKSDNAFEVLAAANHWLRGGPKDGLQLSFSADAQAYAKYSQYNFSSLHAGVSRHGLLGGWRTAFGMSGDEIYFDGLPYQRVLNAEADGHYALDKDRELRLRYRLSRVLVTESKYDYLDGWLQQWRAGMWARSGERRYKAYYQLEWNNRKDFTSTAGNFTSYSPTRHTFLVAATLPLVSQWSVGVDGRYRYSVYNDANDLTGGQKVRADNQYRLGAQVTSAFAKDWEFEAGYSYTHNVSNIASSYSYRRSLISAGVNWFF